MCAVTDPDLRPCASTSRALPRRPADPCADTSLDERHRVDDRDLPGPLDEPHALARRPDGTNRGMTEAGKQFRKVNGFLHLPPLRVALEDYFERGVTTLQIRFRVVGYRRRGKARQEGAGLTAPRTTLP